MFNSHRAIYIFCVSAVVSIALGISAQEVTQFDPSKVPVDKNPKDDSTIEEMSGKPPAKKPGSLSRKDREAAIKRVRAVAGVKKSNLPALPPAMVSLSPDALTQGGSWLGMLKGAIRPKKSEKDVSYMTIGPKEGLFLLHFEPMIPESPYLLDCEVATFPEGKMKWAVKGAFNGIIEDQNGHLMVAFIAKGNVSNFTITRQSGVAIGHLFKCELTRLD